MEGRFEIASSEDVQVTEICQVGPGHPGSLRLAAMQKVTLSVLGRSRENSQDHSPLRAVTDL